MMQVPSGPAEERQLKATDGQDRVVIATYEPTGRVPTISPGPPGPDDEGRAP